MCYERGAARGRATCGPIARDLRPDSSPERGLMRAASPLLRNLPFEASFFGAFKSAGAPDMISTRAQSTRRLPLGVEITSVPLIFSRATARLRRSRL